MLPNSIVKRYPSQASEEKKCQARLHPLLCIGEGCSSAHMDWQWPLIWAWLVSLVLRVAFARLYLGVFVLGCRLVSGIRFGESWRRGSSSISRSSSNSLLIILIVNAYPALEWE